MKKSDNSVQVATYLAWHSPQQETASGDDSFYLHLTIMAIAEVISQSRHFIEQMNGTIQSSH